MRDMQTGARGLALALCALLLLALKPLLPASAEEERVSGKWNYAVSDGEADLRGYNPPFPETLVIPSEIDGYPVRWVDIISKSTWNIERAYESLEVIQAVVVPASVLINEVDLGYLPNLARVDVVEGNGEYASYDSLEGVLYSRDGTELLLCPRQWDGGVLYLPGSVTGIASYALSGCNLEGLALPEGLRKIGAHAFESCSLTGQAGLYLPDGLVSIDDEAFQDAAIAEIHIQKTLQTVGFFSFGGHGQKLLVHEGTYMERYAQVNGYDYELCRSCENAESRLAPPSEDFTEDETRAEDESPSAPAGNLSAIPTPLKKGDKGEGVRRLQVALIEANFLYGEDDGKYGSGTVAAVKALQKKAGRKQTGEFGEADKASLKAGLSADFKAQGKAAALIYNGYQEKNQFTFWLRNTGSTPIRFAMIFAKPNDKKKKEIHNGKIISWSPSEDAGLTIQPGKSLYFSWDLAKYEPLLAAGKMAGDIAYVEVVLNTINGFSHGDMVKIDPPAQRYFPVELLG
jgi:hypothetical protein